MRSRLSLFGLALAGLLLSGAGARAAQVVYTTTGKFALPANPGTNIFTAPNVTIRYNAPTGGAQSVDANPTTNASFGFFDTTGTTATSPVAISTPFTLTIQQLLVDGSPAVGSLDFVGQITGTLEIDSSGAVLQFNAPLSQALPPGVTYSIVNAADAVPGKILIAPPTTNNGVTAIEGRVSVNVIPEPSALALVGLGAVAPLALVLRRRVRRPEA